MAITVPCTTGTVALYQEGAEETILALPVEAWDDTGAAYVAGTSGLVAASTLAGFLRLEAAAIALPPRRAPKAPVPVGPRPRRGPRERPGA
jgi:hypothetical protein